MPAILGRPGEKVLLMGNEAIARGAIEAGISVAAAYPGTPSTEILETIAKVSGDLGIYVEWSTNEKVALEIAIGASMCGLRSIACMKHVGVNVASDPLMSLGYSGAVGGLVVVTADDPNAHSSQNEQDNRLYGIHSYIPVFEPSDVQEAKDLASFLFDFSEKYETAVFLRTTTRISHTRSTVTLGNIREGEKRGEFRREPRRWVLLPANSRRLHREALERIELIAEESHNIAFNKLYEGSSELGFVASGIAFQYLAEAMSRLGRHERPHILKLSLTYPLPRRLVKRLFDAAPKMIVVVEELEPVVEAQLRELAGAYGYEGKIVGKELFPRTGELDVDMVLRRVAKTLGLSLAEKNIEPRIDIRIPPRPPTLCPGCGHRSTYYAVKMAVRRAGVKAVYPNDIGCYTLGFFPPLNLADVSFSMGSSIGIGLGISKVSDEAVISFIGDSTFFHAGIPALIDAVYNGGRMVIIVMDNSITAMTGHQPHPGSGHDIMGRSRPTIKIENLVKAAGVEFVRVIDAYNVRELIDAVVKAISYTSERGLPAVIISRRPCALLEYRRSVRRGIMPRKYAIDQDRCTGCGLCTDWFGCPAITLKDGQHLIIQDLCVGCGVCADICPVKAIHLQGDSE